AMASAESIQKQIGQDSVLPLAGCAIAVKDNVHVHGWGLTCGSKILEGYRALFDAGAVKFLRDAGAVFIGRTNMDEFGMGSSTEHSAYGRTLHPIDPSLVAGGSSGGSAVAVATGAAHAALGSDTGGSVRQPAAFNGLVGLKPTYGSVSRYGLAAFASSFDQIGVIARCVEDAEAVFDVVAQPDDRDATCTGHQPPDFIRPLEKTRIAVAAECFSPSVQPEVAAAVQRAAAVLSKIRRVEKLSLPYMRLSTAVNYTIANAEAATNLARYDGMRYGNAAANHSTYAEMLTANRSSGFGREVRRRILLGTSILLDADGRGLLAKARETRLSITRQFESFFKEYDLLLTPTTPTTAFPAGQKKHDPVEMYLSDLFTTPANVTGYPAINVPFGKDEGGRPIGVQLMAQPHHEQLLFQAARLLEKSV
ncbi:MAG: Asp-tRNA(Asn)/Glu-tRNA(Gln) amidotransferase GatCAB subunit A, partial [Ectothiorhodospiraceae bacterium]|nr:Asp-tRNA(Asn)/Glu-tRNA(Gln) amidotransferase GatCAB subunit A [Ectothiorhodospiraceae bacterium]